MSKNNDKIVRPKKQTYPIDLSPKHHMKLCALCNLGGFDFFNFSQFLMEGAIDRAWDAYKMHPKQWEQVKAWEAKYGKL